MFASQLSVVQFYNFCSNRLKHSEQIVQRQAIFVHTLASSKTARILTLNKNYGFVLSF